MSALRRVCSGRGIGGEALRDILNAKYLNDSEHISSSTAQKWLSKKSPSNPNSRHLLVIKQFITDQTKTK